MKLLKILLVAIFSISLIACGNDSKYNEQSKAKQNEKNEEKTNNDKLNVKDKTLIAYFTYGENANLSDDVDSVTSASIQKYNNHLTGNTGVIAYMISEKIDADIFSIKTSDAYPDSYEATIDQAQDENNDGYRPALSSVIDNFNEYDTIFIGFPNWWYDMPMAMYSFFDEYDFSGKTIIPFNTSGGSGFSDAINTIKELEPNATIHDGLSVDDSDVMDADGLVSDWLNALNY